jgi:hypothetical protein
VHPFIGIQAKLNSNISLTLLSGFQIGSTVSDSESSYQSTPTGPVTNQSTHTESKLVNYIEPSLAFNFRF